MRETQARFRRTFLLLLVAENVFVTHRKQIRGLSRGGSVGVCGKAFDNLNVLLQGS
jgi:hypothetical protein